jgi:DNA polymerase-4
MLIFIYIPGFYAAVEQGDEPELRGRPVAVGGHPEKGGAVISASREAIEHGIESGSTLESALERCPDLQLRPTRLPRYREVSAEMRAILRNVSERIEPLGLDGTYLEPPSDREPLRVAAQICVRVQAELAIRAVAGVAPTRFVANLAARRAGAAGVRQVAAAEVREFLRGLPLFEVWGLGPSTADKLRAQGITTIGHLQDRSLDELRTLVGRPAAQFRELALGQDYSPLRPSKPQQSLSREKTLEEPTADLRALADLLLDLSSRLEEMLTRERRVGRTVTLGVRYDDGEEVTRTLTRADVISKQAELHEIALELLGRTSAGVRAVGRLSLRIARLRRAEDEGLPRQLRLF